MDVKIIHKKEDLFFNRTEIKAEISHQGVPTTKRAEAKKLLAEALNAHADLLVIRRCKSQFGFKALCDLMLYKTKEDLDKNEPAYVKGRESGQKLHKTKEAKAAPAK